MESLYEINGLLFWSEAEIKLRRMFEEQFSTGILQSLREQNSAFAMVQCEAPLLTPGKLINPNYTMDDVYVTPDNLAQITQSEHEQPSLGIRMLTLRPETTMGSFAYARHILSGYNDIKFRPPIVVFQHGKSFRREQDQATKFMRLKEFYQLEFQIIYGLTTANDYTAKLYPAIQKMMTDLIGPCRLEDSDRLPSYSTRTVDVVCEKTNMEVCSMSQRTDFENYKVIEVAIGTDRCIYNFQNK